ncbi:MAG: ORF6N domain-containing protein [bacterium]|nr:ORF6N domain-containing protein [bacterium]
MNSLVPIERIESKIFLIRGQKVMLDRDLAELYEVATKNLNKAVKRNIERFPEDFMFQLTREEFVNLKFHFGTSSWGGTRTLPYAFTEQGVAMLSSVLRSKRAILVNIQIMRTFTKIREILSTHKELAHKLAEHERKIERHDVEIKAVFEAIRQLMTPPTKEMKKIGFRHGGE